MAAIMEPRVDGGVAWVTIDHPPDHLVDAAFLTALATLLPALEADAEVRVAVFRSADPDFFLMHGDVHGILAIPAPGGAPVTEPNPAAALFQQLQESRLVTIGMLDGIARGGGAEFLAALDLRYASTRAVLGQPEVAMGILPGAGGTTRLPRLLGRSKALEIILTGRDVDGTEAAAIGWVDAVVAPDELEPTVRRIAERIATAPAAAIAAVKRVVDRSDPSIAHVLTEESAAFAELLDAGDHRRRMERFLAAGGQTRAAERGRIDPLLEAMAGDA